MMNLMMHTNHTAQHEFLYVPESDTDSEEESRDVKFSKSAKSYEYANIIVQNRFVMQ